MHFLNFVAVINTRVLISTRNLFNLYICNFAGILVKGLYEIWGEGSSYEELKEAINSYPDDRKLPYLTPDSTFRIIIDSFGKAMSFKDQTAHIKEMSYIPFQVHYSDGFVTV